MSDRELLELAAKAAGIHIIEWPGITYGEAKDKALVDGSIDVWWNPLTDDGDALRLAVKLRMNVVITDAGPSVRGDRGPWCDEHCAANDDIFAATRRAIVRAAAAIGESMP